MKTKFFLIFLLVPTILYGYQLNNQEGDVGIWLCPTPRVGQCCYTEQMRILSFSAECSSLNLYSAMWGDNVRTWDNTPDPLTKQAFATHVQPLKANANVEIPRPGILVVLRFVPKYESTFDTEVFVQFYEWAIKDYGLPFRETDDLYMGRISLDNFTPMIGTSQTASDYMNIASPNFWNRKYDCASATGWALMVSWYYQADSEGKQAILNLAGQQGFVYAFDLLTPGVLGWVLHQDLMTIVDVVDPYNQLTDLQRLFIK